LKINSEKMRKSLFLVIISFFLFQNGYAQNVEESFQIAVNKMEQKKYEEALILLKRIAFFADSSFKPLVYLQLGDVYAYQKSYSVAKSYYETAFFSTQNDSLKAEITFRQSAMLLLEHQPDLMLKLVDYALPVFISSKINHRKNLYKTLAWIEKNNFDSAQWYYQNSFLNPNLVAIDSIFNVAKKARFYAPQKAKILSAILPGLGQVYVKNYKNAVNSFVINAGLLSLSVYATLNYTWFEGCVLILPWWQKYYLGGLRRAALLAEKHNDTERNKIINLVLDYSGQIKK
jgi:tetratricopeptide (TPR) repeat protein